MSKRNPQLLVEDIFLTTLFIVFCISSVAQTVKLDTLVSQGSYLYSKGDTLLRIEKPDKKVNKLATPKTEKLSQDSIYITVFASFIVTTNGLIKNAKVIKTVCDSCTTEMITSAEADAIKLINKMPPFKNQDKNLQFVDVSYTLPMRFVLPK